MVKSGSVKSFVTDSDGSEQILGFHLPGELIGLSGIEKSRHSCSAKVLETSSFCEVPFDSLESLASRIPALQHQLFRLLSKEIGNESGQLILLGQKTAEQRLAAFLENLASRYSSRGLSNTEFILSMSRNEIGNYLGLAVETISRLFTRFQDEKLLKVERKHIQLLEIERLRCIVQGEERNNNQRLFT